MDEDDDKKPQNSIKITLIGDSGVGKTCIIRRYTLNEFTAESLTTDGVSYSKKDIMHGDEKIQLDLWDTAGQEKYRS
jgi:small GTP-binding protein